MTITKLATKPQLAQNATCLVKQVVMGGVQSVEESIDLLGTITGDTGATQEDFDQIPRMVFAMVGEPRENRERGMADVLDRAGDTMRGNTQTTQNMDALLAWVMGVLERAQKIAGRTGKGGRKGRRRRGGGGGGGGNASTEREREDLVWKSLAHGLLLIRGMTRRGTNVLLSEGQVGELVLSLSAHIATCHDSLVSPRNESRLGTWSNERVEATYQVLATILLLLSNALYVHPQRMADDPDALASLRSRSIVQAMAEQSLLAPVLQTLVLLYAQGYGKQGTLSPEIGSPSSASSSSKPSSASAASSSASGASSSSKGGKGIWGGLWKPLGAVGGLLAEAGAGIGLGSSGGSRGVRRTLMEEMGLLAGCAFWVLANVPGAGEEVSAALSQFGVEKEASDDVQEVDESGKDVVGLDVCGEAFEGMACALKREHAEGDLAIGILHTLVSSSPSFRVCVDVRSDVEMLMEPLAHALAGPLRTRSAYLALGTLIILSASKGWTRTLFSTYLAALPVWMTGSHSNSGVLSMGSVLVTVVVDRVVNMLGAKAKDLYEASLGLSVLYNLALGASGIQPHPSERVLILFELLAKKHKLLVRAESADPGDVATHTDLLYVMSEIVSAWLSSLHMNPCFVYVLLRRTELFANLGKDERFASLLHNVGVVQEYFASVLADAAKLSTVEEVMAVITDALWGWTGSDLHHLPQAVFSYTPASDLQTQALTIFPHVWYVVVLRSPLPFDRPHLRLFPWGASRDPFAPGTVAEPAEPPRRRKKHRRKHRVGGGGGGSGRRRKRRRNRGGRHVRFRKRVDVREISPRPSVSLDEYDASSYVYSSADTQEEEEEGGVPDGFNPEDAL